MLDEIQKRQPIWSGYFSRIDETRLPKRAFQWLPLKTKGSRYAGGRNGIVGAMVSRDFNEEGCFDSLSVD